MYIARQPIFKKNLEVYGYELLFRNDVDSKMYSGVSSQSATAVVLGGLFEHGIEHIVSDAKAFVNFDYDFLMSDAIELIDPSVLVIEILENVKIDELILDRILELKMKGYHIALDDFENDEYSSKAIPFANIIKYDVLNTPLKEIEKEVKEAVLSSKILLAEKIETEEEFYLAKKMGFQLFQGYFFCKPNIIASDTNGKKTSTAVYAQILSEIRSNEFNYDSVVKIIEADVNISYRLIKIIGNKKIEDRFNSIKNVLIRMGKKEIERWISVLMLQEISDNKPDELFKLSLIRSKFSELLAINSIFKRDKEEISLMCLFSLIDVILEEPMEDAIKSLPLSKEIVNTLLYGSGKYAPLCKLIGAYEKGDWNSVNQYVKEIGIEQNKVSNLYLNAIEWTKKIIESY